MKRYVSAAAIGLIATVAIAQPGGQRMRRPVSPHGDLGLCRHAPTLAALGPELGDRQQQQRPYRGGEAMADRSDRDIAVTGSRIRATPPSVVAPPPIVSEPAPPPAPPPPAPMVADDSAARADVTAPVPSPGRGRGGYPQPQAGILTAGEHDDLLNPELYARYVHRSDLGQRWQTLPLVDTDRALTVAVTDAAGRPMPLADVVLTCADGNSLTLKTLSDGTAVFFPALDRLGDSVRLSVRISGTSLAPDRRIAIPAAPGPQRVSVTAAADAAAPRKFDLMLMVDTTGSMGDELSYLKAELGAITTALRAAHPQLDMRIGMIFYRDVGDDYVTASIPFGGDVDAAQAVLRRQFAGGGGDYPEAVDQAMNRAVNDFQWRPDAVKSLLWVADAPPHDDLIGPSWAAAEIARAHRIQIVPVAASGVAKEAEFVMRAMAALTQSRYLFLTDDSGVGLPHSRPAIDCYLVTRLDALVRRVLDSQISGRRIEPRPDEVIRTVGHYDAGKCRLPAGDWQQED